VSAAIKGVAVARLVDYDGGDFMVSLDHSDDRQVRERTVVEIYHHPVSDPSVIGARWTYTTIPSLTRGGESGL